MTPLAPASLAAEEDGLPVREFSLIVVKWRGTVGAGCASEKGRPETCRRVNSARSVVEPLKTAPIVIGSRAQAWGHSREFAGRIPGPPKWVLCYNTLRILFRVKPHCPSSDFLDLRPRSAPDIRKRSNRWGAAVASLERRDGADDTIIGSNRGRVTWRRIKPFADDVKIVVPSGARRARLARLPPRSC